MPRLNSLESGQAVDMLQAGSTQDRVAGIFGVNRRTILRLWSIFSTTGSISDTTRSGRPRVTTPREDRYIRRTHRQNRFEPASEKASALPNAHRVAPQTVRNGLHDNVMRVRHPFRGPNLTPDWARTHATRGVRWCNSILFSEESRFLLRRVDGRGRVY